MSVVFSKSLIDEYKTEMYETYGVLLCDEDAQIQLLALTRSIFPSSKENVESWREGGDSITPTSGQRDDFNQLTK